MDFLDTQFKPNRNIGVISTRLAGTDGVSLESEKLVRVLEQEGFKCFYFAGELDRDAEKCHLAPEAHFNHPRIQALNRICFKRTMRGRDVTKEIQELKMLIKAHLYEFIDKFKLGVLLAENCLTIPMNIPLGLALTELIAETNILTIAHHHDFYWERDRFMNNAVSDYLNMAFPPNLPSIRHTVINTYADEQLSLRTGISARILPNIMDFENPPPAPDDYAADIRQALGLNDEDLLILQPTRVVKRKGIEHAIELIHRLGRRAKLVISHASGDEGHDYAQRLRVYAMLMNVEIIFAGDIINEKRGRTADDRKIYTLEDIYPHADLVTYPSTFEGFGNAFLEAVYFRKPIVVNAYAIYNKDIKPKGFDVVELDGYVTVAAIQKTKRILEDKTFRHQMVEHNYELGKKFFSYAILRQRVRHFMSENQWLFDEDQFSSQGSA